MTLVKRLYRRCEKRFGLGLHEKGQLGRPLGSPAVYVAGGGRVGGGGYFTAPVPIVHHVRVWLNNYIVQRLLGLLKID
jgi:hypothetical protein